MSEKIVSGYMTPQGGTVCVDCTGLLEEKYASDNDYFQIYEDSNWQLAPECGICRSVIKVIEVSLIRVCAWCKKDLDTGKQLTDAEYAALEKDATRGICPECSEKHLPEGAIGGK